MSSQADHRRRLNKATIRQRFSLPANTAGTAQ